MLETIKELLGFNLRRIRKSRGLTQGTLSESAGISELAVQRIESGDRWPEINTIKQIAIALNVPDIDLFQSLERTTPPLLKEQLDKIVQAVQSEKNPKLLPIIRILETFDEYQISVALDSVKAIQDAGQATYPAKVDRVTSTYRQKKKR